jgi:hypothetical protein
MRIEGFTDSGNYIEFAYSSAEREHYPSIAFKVQFAARGLSVDPDEIWFGMDEFHEFIHQLEVLEQVRQGEAKLIQFSDPSEFCPLRFKIFSIDTIGHMAVTAETVRIDYIGNRATLVGNKLSVTFEIDPSLLPTILADFRAIVHDHQF